MRKKPKLVTFDRPFTRAEFLAAGGGRRALRGARYREIVKTIFIEIEQEDSDARVRAALMVHPERRISPVTGARRRVLRLPVPDNPFEHVTVRDRKDRRYRPWLKPHVTIRKRGVIVVRGIQVTDPITTFLQMAGHLSLVDLVVLGDAIVRQYRISPARLLKAARASTDYYAAAARRAAAAYRPERRGLADGDSTADAHRSGRSARTSGEPRPRPRGRIVATPLRSVLPQDQAGRRVQRPPPSRGVTTSPRTRREKRSSSPRVTSSFRSRPRTST